MSTNPSKIYDVELFPLIREDLRQQFEAIMDTGDRNLLAQWAEFMVVPHFKLPPRPPREGMFAHLQAGENAGSFKLIEAIVNRLRSNEDYTWGTHFGLYGPASVGKTTAAIAIAKGLEIPCFPSDSNYFNESAGVDRFLSAVNAAHNNTDWFSQRYCDSPSMETMVFKIKPTVIFIDEAHMLSTSNQNILLTMMEAPYRVQYRKNALLDWCDVIFILATTDSSQLVKPLRTRTNEIVFESYGESTIAKIVEDQGITDPKTALRVAQAAKLIPRSAIKIAKMIKDSETPGETLKDLYNVDASGLDARDRKILAVLQESVTEPDPIKVETARRLIDLHSQGQAITTLQLAKAHATLEVLKPVSKPVGLANLADRIGVTDMNELRERVNALVNRGFVTRTPRGIVLNKREEACEDR